MAFRVPQTPYDPANDYYVLLDVSFGATAEEIQKAFRQKAKRLHPDHNPNHPDRATAEFQAINSAYTVLSDPTLRKAYDRKRWLYDRQDELSPAYPQSDTQPSEPDAAENHASPSVEQEINHEAVRHSRRKPKSNPKIMVVLGLAGIVALIIWMPFVLRRTEAILPSPEPYTAPIATVSAGCPDPAAQFSRLSDGETVRLPYSVELYAGGPHHIDYRFVTEQVWTTVYESDTWGRHYVRLSIPAGEIVLRLTVDVIDGDQPVTLTCEHFLTVLRIDAD